MLCYARKYLVRLVDRHCIVVHVCVVAMNEIVVHLPQKLQRVQILRSYQIADVHAMEFEEFSAADTHEENNAEPQEEFVSRARVEQELKNAYDRGFEDGREVTSAMLERELGRHEEWLQNFDNIIADLHRRFSDSIGKLEQCSITLAVEIAQHILQREIQSDTAIAIEQVQRAFERINGIDAVTIRLHPYNVDALKKVKSSLLALAGDVKTIDIVADPSIEMGGCVVDTNIGSIDAQIKTQLEQLRATMVKEARISQTPRLEDIDFSGASEEFDDGVLE